MGKVLEGKMMAHKAEPVTKGRTVPLNREIKDSVFSDLFANKTRLLSLYI